MTEEVIRLVVGWDEALRISGLTSEDALRRKARDMGLHILQSAKTREIYFYQEELDRVRAAVEKLLPPTETVVEERDRLRRFLQGLKRRCVGNGSGDGISEVIVSEGEIGAALRGKEPPQRKR